MTAVRVRFCPSPTGNPHVGLIRTGLFNWAYARHTGGTFVFRVEDTDAARDSEQSYDQLLDALRWLGWTGTRARKSAARTRRTGRASGARSTLTSSPGCSRPDWFTSPIPRLRRPKPGIARPDGIRSWGTTI